MSDSSNDNNSSGMLSKQDLWAKAGTSEQITRSDIGVRPAENNSGVQALNEGYLGEISRYSYGNELKHGDGDDGSTL